MDANIKYQFITTKSKVRTVLAQVDGEAPFHLHSNIHPRKEAEEWVKRLELTADTYYIVLGIGLGYHVEALLKSLPANSQVLVLHTKSEDLLVQHLGNQSENLWLSDKRLEFLHLTNIHNMAILIGDIMIKHIIKKVCLCRHFPAMRLAELEYQTIEATLVPSIQKAMALNFNVKVTTEHQFLQNYWKNFPQLIINSEHKFWENAFAHVPVIVVASGPSLNKNIAELKKCADKAVIIAAGSTIGALHRQGITPHFLIVSDANQAMYDEVKDFFSNDTVLIAATNVQYKIVEEYPGTKCFFEVWRGYDDDFKKYLPELMRVRQSGSVTTAAVDFANQCGASRIILVGQDLAVSSNKPHHAEGVKAGDFLKWAFTKTPGYYGGEVDTLPAFSTVINHYHQYVQKNSHIDFINATEGGALIPHMRNLPLKEVSEQILSKKIEIDTLLAPFRSNYQLPQLDKVVKQLTKLLQWIANLEKAIEEFCNKEQTINDNISGREVTPQDIQRFEELYAQIKRRSAYPYIRVVIEGWEGLLKFQARDGMPLDKQYEYYWFITREIQEILNNLKATLSDNIQKIEGYRQEVRWN